MDYLLTRRGNSRDQAQPEISNREVPRFFYYSPKSEKSPVISHFRRRNKRHRSVVAALPFISIEQDEDNLGDG
jgi:hypothetical protein